MDISGYQKTVLATTDRVQIILMLFDGTLNHLKIARQKIENGDTLSKGIHLGKVTAIVSELSNVLDMEKGGVIAENLRNLYNYILQRLLYANLHGDIAAIDDAKRIIETLRDGWKEMMKELKQPAQVGV
jgi:flagellar protein FliS